MPIGKLIGPPRDDIPDDDRWFGGNPPPILMDDKAIWKIIKHYYWGHIPDDPSKASIVAQMVFNVADRMRAIYEGRRLMTQAEIDHLKAEIKRLRP